MSEIKLALCVAAAEAFSVHPVVWNTYLVDRAIADNQTEIDTVNLQILPYISLGRQGDSSLGENAEETYLLTYDRGSKGGESRLHALSSIGFGGHIDSDVTTNLINLVAEEALRELKEELGYVPDTRMFYHAVTAAIMERRFIYEPDTDTGKVHLGLFISIPFEAPVDLSTLTLEDGHISNVRWINGPAITDAEISKFEPWSALILKQNQTPVETTQPTQSTEAIAEDEIIHPAPILTEIISAAY